MNYITKIDCVSSHVYLGSEEKELLKKYPDINDWRKVLNVVDVYPCLQCYSGFSYCYTNEMKIKNAIYFFELHTLKKLINTIDKEEILALKPIEFIISELFSGKKRIKNSLGDFNCYDFNDSRKTLYKKVYLQMLELLCEEIPKAITNECFVWLNTGRCPEISIVLNSHYITDVSKEDVCYICLTDAPNSLIPNVCSCKNKVHFDCLLSSYTKM